MHSSGGAHMPFSVPALPVFIFIDSILYGSEAALCVGYATGGVAAVAYGHLNLEGINPKQY